MSSIAARPSLPVEARAPDVSIPRSRSLEISAKPRLIASSHAATCSIPAASDAVKPPLMLSEDLDPGLRRRTAVREGSGPCLASLAQTLVLLGTLQNARSQAEPSSWRGQS
jgi:hypothetical protein